MPTHPLRLLAPIPGSLLRALAVAVLGACALSTQVRGFGADDSERAAVALVLREGTLQAGGRGHLGVVLDIVSGWKIQAGRGSGDEIEPYIPTTIELVLPEGWRAGAVLWPPAVDFTMGDGDWKEELRIYEGRTLAIVPLELPAEVAPGEYPLEAEVGYQACDKDVCEPPTSVRAVFTMTVVAAGAAPASAEDPELDALFRAALERPSAAPPAAVSTVDGEAEVSSDAPRPTFFGIRLPHLVGAGGLLLLALLSALGGFVLNLTPCVLPVIPIKVMTMMQHAGSPGRSFVLGLWMAAGVVTFWAGIGLPVAFFASVTDPSQVFGIWWVTAGIGALIAVMAVGVMGAFDVQLPQAVYAVRPKADSPGGSFLFGVMTAVLGLPCFGFVAGALLAGAATLPPLFVMVIFTSLGIGMALPYLVLAARPSLLSHIPRTGPASDLVKQVMGFLLLAAAAYFLGSGLIALVAERPYLGRLLHWWVVTLCALSGGGWLILRTFQITERVGKRIVFSLLGLLLGGAALTYTLRATDTARAQWELRQAALSAADGGGYGHGIWNTFSASAFERARESGAVVVLDFTAEWCLICKYLKATVLEREPVTGALAAEGVVRFTVDLTSLSAPGWAFLRALGQTGIPLLAIYTPGEEDPWLASAYTAPQVVEALTAARNAAR